MATILGISAYYHDAAAALVVDGRIVAAAQEERFTRKKHDPDFPQNAVEYCLREADITAADLDYVGFYDKPITKFERLLETYLATSPRGYRSFRRSMPVWLKEKLHVPRLIRKALGGRYRGRYVFTDHHESHAASAFFPSPFDEAAILTIDGVGEWSTTCFGIGRGNRIELTREIRFPHSLGLLYAAFTYYTGFRINSGEYKVMGLAPYGKPVYKDLILGHLIDLKEDGSYRMDMSYFNYCQGLTMTSRKFDRLFGGPPRKPESRLAQREMDLAASIQAVTEEVMLRTARHVHTADRHEEPGAGRRRGAELRGQRPSPPRRPFRESLDPTRRGRRRRGAGYGTFHLAPTAGELADPAWARRPTRLAPRPGVQRRRDCRSAARQQGPSTRPRRTTPSWSMTWPRF